MKTTKRMLEIAAFLAATALVIPGCLLKETTQVCYIDASGGVTWVITETDVRSDANNATDRQQEESVYWLAVQQQRHPIAMGLQELGGTKVRTTALRTEAPYTVRTEARFSGLDEIGRRMLAAIGALGESTMKREGTKFEWKMVARDPHSIGSVNEPSEGVSAVLSEFDSLRIVLLTGKFESADGFEISRDGRIATIDKKLGENQPEEQAITIRLAWK